MRNTLGFALALAGAVTALPSHAADVYPGASCRAVGSSQGTLRYDDRGRVHNTGTAALKVVCPITRENSVEGWTGINVVVSDRHSTQNVTCEAFSGQTDGLGWSLTQSSREFSPEWYQSETLAFGAPTEVRDNGTYYLVCSLPPAEAGRQSTLASYRVAERCIQFTAQTSTSGSISAGTYHGHSVTQFECY